MKTSQMRCSNALRSKWLSVVSCILGLALGATLELVFIDRRFTRWNMWAAAKTNSRLNAIDAELQRRISSGKPIPTNQLQFVDWASTLQLFYIDGWGQVFEYKTRCIGKQWRYVIRSPGLPPIFFFGEPLGSTDSTYVNEGEAAFCPSGDQVWK